MYAFPKPAKCDSSRSGAVVLINTSPSKAPNVMANNTAPTPASRADPEVRCTWANSSIASTSANPGSRMIRPEAKGIHSANGV